MHLKQFTQINHLQLQSIFSMVYSESGLKVEKSNKTTETMNGTTWDDVANQNPAYICTLEK